MTAAEALASMPPPPLPPQALGLSAAEKAAKDKLENPTVDSNGEHLQTVAEAKIEAAAMQQALDMGLAAVEAKVNAPVAPEPEPVPEKDDGHEETVEEVKAKMAAAQQAMDEGINHVSKQAEERAKQEEMMPDMNALTSMGGSLHRMSQSKNQRQVNLLAARLGVQPQPGDAALDPATLSTVMVQRAEKAGKTHQEIDEALKEV